jgi:hypothetical protein
MWNGTSEECSVPLTTTVDKTIPDIKPYGRHTTDKLNESVLAPYKHSVMIMMAMRMLIRNPTHQIQVNNLIHHKTKITMILTQKVQTAQTVQVSL